MTSTRTLVAPAVAFCAALLPACSGPPVSPTAPMLTGAAAPHTSSHSRPGSGNSPYQLVRAGWRCVNVPGHGVHCEDPHWDQDGVHVQVKVFATADVASEDAPFLGTESLIRADRYQGQPCLPGHGEYFLLTAGPRAGYYICHHFDF